MTDIVETQMSSALRKIVDDEIELYSKRRTISARNKIPATTEIPIEDPLAWIRVHDVICVFVDMLGSTKMSVSKKDNSTAGIYRLFTSTAIRFFHERDAPYIDVKGDGVFALFNKDQVHRALVSAVDFKTFSSLEFVPRVKKKTDLDIGTHIGISQRTVLVRKLGIKRYDGRTDRQNEVWAGKAVNMAAKLGSMTKDGELLASERFYMNLKDKRATHSCGCNGSATGTGDKVPLWKEVELPDDGRFDFKTAWRLESLWCANHGKEFAEGMLADEDEKD